MNALDAQRDEYIYIYIIGGLKDSLIQYMQLVRDDLYHCIKKSLSILQIRW